MVLGFKARFVDKILSKSKIHTIRADKNDRWKIGNTIQFATGVRTKFYNCFLRGVCLFVQKIEISYLDDPNYKFPTILIDGVLITRGEFSQLVKNDGFDSTDEFLEWFDADFSGKIIHWTNKIY